MKVLVLYDTEIKAWLVNEPLENVEEHIRNGYPELLGDYQAGIIKAEVIEVPYNELYRDDLYEVSNGMITRKL
jgi:hypothetical protein